MFLYITMIIVSHGGALALTRHNLIVSAHDKEDAKEKATQYFYDWRVRVFQGGELEAVIVDRSQVIDHNNPVMWISQNPLSQSK